MGKSVECFQVEFRRQEPRLLSPLISSNLRQKAQFIALYNSVKKVPKVKQVLKSPEKIFSLLDDKQVLISLSDWVQLLVTIVWTPDVEKFFGYSECG